MNLVKVDCYAGYKADQRPIRFVLGSNIYIIEQVEDQWYGPSAQYFRVKANDGNLYILKHDETGDSWTLEAYRACGPSHFSDGPDQK